ERRLQPEDGEVRARDEHRGAGRRLAAERDVDLHRPVRGEAGEPVGGGLEVAEHGVAEDGGAVAGDVAARAVLGARRGEVDQPFRLVHRKRPEQDLLEEGEDRRVGADPQRKGQYGNAGHERRPTQRTEGESQVVHDVLVDGPEWFTTTASPRQGACRTVPGRANNDEITGCVPRGPGAAKKYRPDAG